MERVDTFMNTLLSSGVQVVGQPMRGVQSAAIGFLIGTGARDEDPARAGISHFTEQTLFRGTEHQDARTLSDRFDALGINYDSGAGLESSSVTAVLIGDRLPAAVDLLVDVLRYPAFPDDAVDNVRTLLDQERRQREDSPAQTVMERVREEFYRDSPLAHDPLGTAESLASISRADLQAYWQRRYTINNMTISVAGNFDWRGLVDQLERLTTGWPDGPGRMVAHEPVPHPGVVVIDRAMAQENLAFAFPGVSAADEHYYAASCLAQALGGGMTSRLFREVREKRGLAYSIQARFDGLEKTGLFRIYCGTSVDRAHESVEVILEQLHVLEAEGITEDELELAKTKLKSQVVMRSESTSARMAANLRSWWLEGKVYSLRELQDRIDHVTVDEVHGLVAGLNPTRDLAAVALGPRSQDELFGGILAPTQ